METNLRFPNDDLRVANNAERPSQIVNRKSYDPRFQVEAMLQNLDLETQLAVIEALKEELALEAVTAEQEQLAIAQSNSGKIYRSIDGVGPQELSMSPTVYGYYKTVERLDFSSKKDRKFLTNRYPEMKVRSGGTKLMVGWSGEKKFSKSYAESRRPE